MLYIHVVALASLALCVAEDGSKRAARNPALLHLAHAGHSVGSYAAPGGAGGAEGAGPQILIYGGHPQVTTRVVSKDSLEELDEDIRQYQQQQPQHVRYVPNTSFRAHYFGDGRQSSDLPGFKDSPAAPQYTPGHDFPSSPTPLAFSYPRTYGHLGVAPVLYNPTAHHPFAGLGSFASHSAHQTPTPTSTPSHYSQAQNTATPATANYATPTSYPSSPTATPLSHPLASPILLPSRVPYHGVAPAAPIIPHGLRYPTPLSLLPVQVFGPHLNFYRNQGHPQYSEGDGRSYKDEQGSEEDERPSYYGGSQGRRPMEYQQREYEDDGPAYSGENTNYQTHGKYESNESLPKSAATPSYQTYPSEDKGSYEEASHEAGSAEKGFKFNFADSKARSSPLVDGEGKVATSYQSVTFETHHPVPLHYPKKH